MRYYIFAGDTESITTNINNSIFSSEKYSEIREYFDKINSEYRYNHSYLIADYCTYRSTSVFSKDMVSILDVNHCDKLPFLPIGEFHYNPANNESTIIKDAKVDLGLAIRKDMLVIEADGFSRTFFNNGQAAEIFEELVVSGTPAEMSICYSIDKDGMDVEITRFVANSIDVIRTKKSDIGKIMIGRTPYKELKRKNKFINMDLSVVGFGESVATA